MSDANLIYFADVLPGAGKTLWALQKMEACLKNKKGIILYVAPTHALLEEVESRLSTYATRVHHIRASTNTEERTTATLRLLIDGGTSVYGEVYPECREGNVILCTHDTFLRLSNDLQSPASVRRRSAVVVIFDEARKCVLKESSFTFPGAVTSKLLNSFIFREEVPDGHEFGKIHLKRGALDNGAFDALFAHQKKSRKFRQPLLDQLVTLRDDPNVDLYASIKRKADKATTDFVFQTLLVPRRIFHGWQKAILLAAFFKNSQMYHLLKQHDISDLAGKTDSRSKRQYAQRVLDAGGTDNLVRLVDISRQVVPAERLATLLARYKDLHVTYISPTVRFTMHHLKNSVLVGTAKPSVLKNFGVAYRKWSQDRGFKFPPLRTSLPWLFQGSKDEVLRDLFTSIRIHKEYSALTPVAYYARASVGLSKAWLSSQSLPPAALPILVNVGTKEGATSRNRYWVTEVSKVVPEAAALEVPFVNHGLNKFRKLNTLAFLATLNPRPTTVRLFQQLCPAYQPDLDHTVDQAVQTAMRISVRDVHSDTKPLVIVTDRHLAEAIVEHLLNAPTLVHPQEIIPGFPKLDPFFLAAESREERAQRIKADPVLSSQRKASSQHHLAQHRARNKDRDTFIKENSKYAKNINSLAMALTRAKRAGHPFEDTQAELTKMRAAFKDEKVHLLSKFNSRSST